MQNKPLISIAIPTYNRAKCLESLLNNIAPQAEKLKGSVQICISNNCSTDNTEEVILDFQKKYPGLIKYSKNDKNLGCGPNMLKAIEISEGDFAWLIGDDDTVVADGIEKVLSFIKNNCTENTGLINIGQDAYFADKKTGQKVVFYDTVLKDKPNAYKINQKDIITRNFPSSAFISVLLYNNNFAKKIFNEEADIIKKSVGNSYTHVLFYQLMFLKYPKLQAERLNEKIIEEELHYNKLYVEDKFEWHYDDQLHLAELLILYKYTGDYYKKIFKNGTKTLAKNMIIEMGVMKAFKTFNYSSFFDCIKMFFKRAPLVDALLFCIAFTFFSIIPSFILKNLYKMFIRIRHKEWKKVWDNAVIIYSEASKGTQRLKI